MFKGVSEASAPDTAAWRQVSFSDAAWTNAPAPIFYSTAPTEPPFYSGGAFEGTTLADMQFNYSSVFLRKTFVVWNTVSLAQLNLSVACDDGFIAWLNGVEILRVNMPAGDVAFNGFALGSVAEPVPLVAYAITNLDQSGLLNGTNVLAVHVFNRSLDSSDLGFMAQLESLEDDIPPAVLALNPPATATVRSLTQIDVRFTEAVTNVDATDLLINGVPALGLTVLAPDQYRFTFVQPAAGDVSAAWAVGNGISDLALNSFAGGSWSYVLETNSVQTNNSTGTVFINEFMAANSKTLLDENGDSSDWIELFNPGPTAVFLDGWFLTDDAADRMKWRFPSTNLAANASVLVFASGKDRAVPGAPLHTNFKLDNAGGYLALVRPDGMTVASEITYPAQRTDVSYGISREMNAVPLLAAGSLERVLVPTDGALGWQWTGGTEPFDDSSWLAATNGVGFDQSTNAGPSLIGWWAFNDASNPALARDASGGNHTATISSGPTYTADAGGRTGQPGDRALSFSGTGYAQVPDAGTGMFDSATAHDAITIGLWILGDASQPQNASVFYGGGNPDGSGTRSLNAHLPWSDSVIYWDTSGCCDPSSTRVMVAEPDSTKWKGRWNHYAFVKNGDTKEIWENGARILQGVNTANLTTIRSFLIGAFDTGNSGVYHGLIDDFAVWDQALTATQIQALAGGAPPAGIDTLTSLINTDLAAVMRNQNASAYVRAPFVLTGAPDFDLLLLRMNYDDGFVCWLNGVEVARRNAPTSLVFNSTATVERARNSARQTEEIDLSSFISLLHPATNVLAIQGLNFSASDAEYLVLPQLVTGRTAVNRFFTTPTPGAPNGTGVQGFVADTHFEPNRGFYFTPVDVNIWTETPGATLVYTTNGNTPSLTYGIVAAGTNATVHLTTTTVLRAAAFKGGFEPTDVDTHSYIFPVAVANQTRPPSIPSTWPDGSLADFAMDGRVINNALPGYRLTNALLSTPSISLVMPASDLFGAAGGIYANPLLEVERAASVEMLFPDGQRGFQENGGVQVRGLSSEYNSLTPKHSFTATFRSEYGAVKVDFPVFPDTKVREFNSLVLRGNVLDSWANSETDFNHLVDGELRWYRTRASYVRDQWMRDSQLAQDQPSSHGRFVHLYLNGFYWGIYNLDERADEYFAAFNLGGTAAEYDVIHDSELKGGTFDAWNQLMGLASADLSNNANYQRLMGNNSNGTRNNSYPVLLDVTNLVDYMILHIYAGADDWPWHNWVALRRRTPDSTGFKFLAWDQEISINSLVKQHTDGGQLYAEADAGNCPAHVYARCRVNAEFRQFFADRVQHHMFNGGALSISNNIARYDARVAEIDHAIVAESARWGDFYRPSQPYRREAEWLGTNQWMRATFFPSNHFIALKRFRDAGLFSTINAPVFSQFGGAVSNDFALTITNPNTAGVVEFTIDSVDPRRPGGSIAPTAQVYSAPVGIDSPTLVRARVHNGTAWSALVEAVFYPPQDLSQLALTEIMYHPPAVGATNADEFEFLELKNFGTNTLDLSGLTFSSGINFTFTNRTLLAPGGFFVIGRNAAAFAAKYPGASLDGVFTGKLDNGGETLTLAHPFGGTIFSVTYGDAAPWPVTPSGFGFSLVPNSPGVSQAPDDGAKWRASVLVGGSPGADDPEPNIPPIVINEILTHTDLPQVDAIELFNPTLIPVNLGGWFLTDDANTPKKFRIRDGTSIPGFGFITFDEYDFNPAPGVGNSFALDSHGEQVYLFSGDANTNLTGYSHGFSFGGAANGVTFGRYLNSVGDEQFPAQIANTLGATNSGPRVGPVVISEIHYHPAAGGDEFLELQNIVNAAVPLFDPAFPTNTWRLNGLGYTFPTNLSLATNGLLLLVATNPVVFRSKYSVPTNVLVLGPYPGSLQKGGERLQLQRPDAPDTNGLPLITVDEVRYNNKKPWPLAADGSGLSLQRITAAAYGNDPSNWQPAEPTPGQLNFALDTDGDGLPDWWEIANGTDQLVADAAADPDLDGMTNWQEYLAGTSPTNAASLFRIDSAAHDLSGNIVLSFTGIANHSYTVYTAATLAPPVFWQPVTNTVATSNGMINVALPANKGGRQFFRLGIP